MLILKIITGNLENVFTFSKSNSYCQGTQFKIHLFHNYATFYTPVKDGTYYGITRGIRTGGRHHNSLSGAYLQDYASYGYENSWVDRSH